MNKRDKSLAGATDDPALKEVLRTGLAETDLSVRICNMLEEAKPPIITVKDLLDTRKETLLALPNFGEKCLQDCFEALASLGLEAEDPRPPSSSSPSSPLSSQPEKRKLSREERRRLPLKATKLGIRDCVLLATGGLETVETVIDCDRETLLFLLSQGRTRAETQKSYFAVKRVIEKLGFRLKRRNE